MILTAVFQDLFSFKCSSEYNFHAVDPYNAVEYIVRRLMTSLGS